MTKNLPSTFVQREKYPFLPDDVFIPIESPIVPEEISGKYGINKKGEIIYYATNKIRKPYIDYQGYFIISFEVKIENKRITKKYRVHRLVALIFLNNPNYSIYNVINHKDCVRANNSLYNLEWVTALENSSSEKKSKIRKEISAKYIGRDESGNIIESFIAREVPEKYSLKKIQNTIYNKRGKCYGLFWTCEKVKRDIYGFSGNLNDYEWHEHWKYPGIYVCKEGFIKNSNGLLYGLNPTKGSYVMVKINRRNLLAHRVIMEYILGRELKREEIVDHINTIRIDNSFSNLRVTDAKGNVNNKNTLKSISNNIIVADLFGDYVYSGITRDVYKFVFNTDKYNGINDSSTVLKTTVVNSKYICFKRNDTQSLFKKLNKIYYLIDIDNNKFLGAFTCISDIARSNLIDGITINNISKRKDSLGNGLKILKGSDAFDLLRSLGHLTAEYLQNNLEET